MFRDSGEAGKEAEHAEAEGKKREELYRRIKEAQATPYHPPLLQVCPCVLWQFRRRCPLFSCVITRAKFVHNSYLLVRFSWEWYIFVNVLGY